MGIQTFNESILKVLQRRHTARQAIEAFQNCRAAGFQNISIDLMYGLPGETLSTWQQDLDQALFITPRTSIGLSPDIRRRYRIVEAA